MRKTVKYTGMELIERKWDEKLNIHTIGRNDTHADEYRYPYEPTPYVVLERLAESGYFDENSIILDYGCGRGRVGLFLENQLKCRSIGIEYDTEIFAEAEENKKACVGTCRIEFVCANAENYPVSKQVDSCYFFNPFSVDILRKVIARIRESYYENPRDITLFFYYPSDEYISYLMTVEELSFIDEIDCSDLFVENRAKERILIFELCCLL